MAPADAQHDGNSIVGYQEPTIIPCILISTTLQRAKRTRWANAAARHTIEKLFTIVSTKGISMLRLVRKRCGARLVDCKELADLTYT